MVAGDSIKRMLAEGQPRIVAPWLGPTKIATAILYATITNIVAYLPFLMITGTTGEFIYSLPIVMTVALVASRLASMTFIPLLGYYLLRPDKKPEAPIEERRTTGFTGFYAADAKFAIEHRWKVAIAFAGCFWCSARFIFSQLKTSFFPDDVQYWSYIDVWLPNDANFDATNQAAQQVEQIIREQADVWGKKHPDKERQACAHLAVRDHLGGRRRPALLVLGLAAAQATELRAGAGAADGQRHHAASSSTRCSRCCRRATARACAATIGSCKPTRSIIRSRFASSARPT